MRSLRLTAALYLAFGIQIVGAESSLPPNVPLKIRLEFHVEPREMADLRNILERFAEAHHLTVADQGPQMPPKEGRAIFDMQIEEGNIVNIIVTNIRQENRMFVWMYEYRSPSDLYDLDFDLEKILRNRWPSLAPYEGL